MFFHCQAVRLCLYVGHNKCIKNYFIWSKKVFTRSKENADIALIVSTLSSKHLPNPWLICRYLNAVLRALPTCFRAGLCSISGRHIAADLQQVDSYDIISQEIPELR